MDVTDNTHLVFAFFAALSHGDMAGAQALLADHTTWWLPGTLLTSGVYKQRGAILEECQDYASIEVCHAVGEGNHVAVEWVARGHSPQGPRYGNYDHLITCPEGGCQGLFNPFQDTFARLCRSGALRRLSAWR